MSSFDPSCPVPDNRPKTVQLAHGGGGRLMRSLIENLFKPAFTNPALAQNHDSAVVMVNGTRLAFTTDSFVVSPLFFPGGDIGSLAVYGTVNDLAMAGAEPLHLSCGFILEEGFPLRDLERIVESMRAAARETGVTLVTGDTKVVDRGKGDGVFVNTTGIGAVPDGVDIGPHRVRPGDVVLLSGDVGRHGIAILSVREGLEFEGALESDCGNVVPLVRGLVDAGVDIRCLRDLTRGGLASALNEIAADGAAGIEIAETAVPVEDTVAGACEMLGLDPLYVANEGRIVVFVPEADADRALSILAASGAPGPVRIGRVRDARDGRVLLHNRLGGTRLLDLLSGEQLPRIC